MSLHGDWLLLFHSMLSLSGNDDDGDDDDNENNHDDLYIRGLLLLSLINVVTIW